MSEEKYLLVLSLGPVQGFIAAARRCRDLWCGSWLLSEISKAAAKSLREAKADLIFPAVEDCREVDFWRGFSVGNKVQAIVTGDAAAVRHLADEARAAARRRFRQLADEARQSLSLRDDIWTQQVDDYVECFAAWAHIGEGNKYGDAVKLANEVLAARKATRDFEPSALTAKAEPFYGLPKSSLDGARETVLEKGRYPQLRLSPGEQLDCAGIVKRQAGDSEQFTALSRICADPWLEKLSLEEQTGLRNAYELLVPDLVLATRVSGNDGCYKTFPYDAQFLFPTRLEAMKRDCGDDAKQVAMLDDLRRAARPLWKKYGEPCPYGVILLADGDRMGALLSGTEKAEDHKKITQALSGFAENVKKTVREHRGHAIYAGGDDVLAFVPLPNALDAARALKDDFAERLRAVSDGKTNPTLSVGLAIGHMLTPLGTLLELARQAEKLAKGDSVPDADHRRNALGIILQPRSGGETSLRLRWDDDSAQKDFVAWMEAFTAKPRKISSRVAYDARQIDTRTRFAVDVGKGEKGKTGIVEAEFARMLARARTDSGDKLEKKIQEGLDARLKKLLQADPRTALKQLANELIVARWLSARTARDTGEN